MAILGAGLLDLAGVEVRSSQRLVDSQRAFWLAEGGKERAFRWIAQQDPPPAEDVLVFEEEAGPDGGSYTVNVVVDTASVYLPEKSFMLESVGRSGGQERRVRQQVRLTCFAQFAYFTDEERTDAGGPIWFGSGDVLEGRVHTNGTFNIRGTPTFLGRVTSSSDHMLAYQVYPVVGPEEWPVHGNDPVFAEGYELNVPAIPFPETVRDLRDESLNGGLYLPAAATVHLGRVGTNPDSIVSPGWLRYKETGQDWEEGTSIEIASLDNKVIYCEGDLTISGLLDGSLTASSQGDIIIVDDLLYAGADAAGAPLPGCDDMLGLVAERNIVLEYDDSIDPLPTYDLKIDGILMALNTSMTARDYRNGVLRGTLTIWGGVIQKVRGPVAASNGGVRVSGYEKDYHYDTRVTGQTPPGFPMTGTYEKIAWKETWDGRYPF